MDKLKLAVGYSEDNQCETVEIYVNDRKLVDILKEYEAPFAGDIAGEYEGLRPEEVFLPSKHFLGGAIDLLGDHGKIAVMDCVCGCPGCWPFLVRITIENDRIIWSDFEQPHRGPESAGDHWKYDELGPFIFERKQYESELIRK